MRELGSSELSVNLTQTPVQSCKHVLLQTGFLTHLGLCVTDLTEKSVSAFLIWLIIWCKSSRFEFVRLWRKSGPKNTLKDTEHRTKGDLMTKGNRCTG